MGIFFSQFFKLEYGVRQGLVLSPLLFAVYVDELAKSCDCTHGVYLVIYADDILLLSPTVTELQNMLYNCERELDALDLVINVKKSHAVSELANGLTPTVRACVLLLVHFSHGYQKLNT